MSATTASELERAVGDYLRTLEERGLAMSTVANARRTLRLFARELARRGVRSEIELEREAVLSLVARLLGRGIPEKTPAREIGHLRRFTRWLHQEGRTLGDAGSALPQEKTRPREPPRRILGEEEVTRLYGATAGTSARRLRDRALLEALYSGGLRASEAAAIEVRDLDLAQGALTVRRGKGDRPRIVPLPEKAIALLARYVRDARPLLLRRQLDGGALLLGDRGRRLSRGEVWRKVRALGGRAGVGAIWPHALRHAVATHLLRAGVSVRFVQLFLGHRFIGTTAIYTHLVQRDLRATIERAHPREASRRSRRTR